jgi:hypothetical protein
MGLLDPLFAQVLSGFGVQQEDPQGALLSEFLRLPQQPAQAPAQQPLPTGHMMPQAQQAAPQAQPMAPPAPNFLDRLSAMSRGYGEGGLVGGIADAFNLGDSRGERAQAQQRNASMDFLVNEGHFDRDTANALMSGDPDMRKAVMSGVFKTRKGGGAFGKTGTIVTHGGKFYAVRFNEDGTESINPLSVGGNDVAPAKGVEVVGDELINKGDGSTVRNVAPQLQAGRDAVDTGKDIAETRGNLPQAKARLGMVEDALDRLGDETRSLLANPGLPKVAGGIGEAYLPNISSGARNAGSSLENIKTQISGAVMQSMREMSKTGGAAGSMTQQEWPRFENMIANLNASQDLPEFKANLNKVLAYVDNLKARLRTAYEEDVAKVQGGPAAPAAPARPRGGTSPSGRFTWEAD